MGQLILKRSSDAKVSANDAEALLSEQGLGRVLHRSGDNMLVDVDAADVTSLQSHLPGWVVSPQGPTIQVPDTRVKIK
jgi:hypothetical protein